jgi:hypothetical protein
VLLALTRCLEIIVHCEPSVWGTVTSGVPSPTVFTLKVGEQSKPSPETGVGRKESN